MAGRKRKIMDYLQRENLNWKGCQFDVEGWITGGIGKGTWVAPIFVHELLCESGKLAEPICEYLGVEQIEPGKYKLPKELFENGEKINEISDILVYLRDKGLIIKCQDLNAK